MVGQFVLDTSVAMSWCFEDESEEYADAVLHSLTTRQAIVPSIWPLEVGNALVVAERRNRVTEAKSARFLSLLATLSIVLDDQSAKLTVGEILPLARELRVSTYDALYLDTAMRRGLPIATRDKALRAAAANCGIALFKPARDASDAL